MRSNEMIVFEEALRDCHSVRDELVFARQARRIAGYGVFHTDSKEISAANDLQRAISELSASERKLQTAFDKLSEVEKEQVKQEIGSELKRLNVKFQ